MFVCFFRSGKAERCGEDLSGKQDRLRECEREKDICDQSPYLLTLRISRDL